MDLQLTWKRLQIARSTTQTAQSFSRKAQRRRKKLKRIDLFTSAFKDVFLDLVAGCISMCLFVVSMDAGSVTLKYFSSAQKDFRECASFFFKRWKKQFSQGEVHRLRHDHFHRTRAVLFAFYRFEFIISDLYNYSRPLFPKSLNLPWMLFPPLHLTHSAQRNMGSDAHNLLWVMRWKPCEQCSRKLFIRQKFFFNDHFPWQHVPQLPSEIFKRFNVSVCEKTTNGGRKKISSRHLLLDIVWFFSLFAINYLQKCSYHIKCKSYT